MLCALCDLCVQRDSFTSPLGLLGPAAFGSPKGLMTKYDVERRTRRTRRKTLSIFLCGFRGFCVVRDLFTRALAERLRSVRGLYSRAISFQQQRLASFLGRRHQAMVSHDEARARVPSQQRIVVAGRPDGFGLLVPRHRVAQPFVGA